MYDNGKMGLVETTPGMGEGRKKRIMEVVSSTMI
jgi:hypothetical protein